VFQNNCLPEHEKEEWVLRSLEELLGYKLWAQDGHIGEVHDFLFSDEDWMVRYMFVDTGPWILGREVLISLQALGQPVWASQTFPVDLTREQVKTSPGVNLAKPVSRQYEERIRQHYHWPAYWRMNAALPGYPTHIPPQVFAGHEEEVDNENEEESHLRSTKELTGYQVRAVEGEVGKVTDFIVEDEDWQLRYMVVDISDWLEEDKQILVALTWISDIEVSRDEVAIDLTQEAVKFSPPFDPNLAVNRQYEEVLYDYHGKPKYWQAIE
jgi:stress response protein YsnF